ncbi:MAG: hypothetical protein AAGA85_02375 [Bacteroidota bacterium]
MINKEPFIEVSHDPVACWEEWTAIGEEIRRTIAAKGKPKVVIAVECFQGTYNEINLTALKEALSPNATCQTEDIYKNEGEIRQLVRKDLNFQSQTAKVSTNTIDDYFDEDKLRALQSNISFLDEGVILIYGIGAYKIGDPDVLIYSDMSRHEILQRFRRNDISNIGVNNQEDAFDLQHAWSYFIDWRICDRIKKQVIKKCDYFLESNNWQKPKLAAGDVVRGGFDQALKQPIFMAPFFDPELWDENAPGAKGKEDFAWGFNCDIEEDNILLKIGESLMEFPAINLLYYQPVGLLGDSIYRKFGSDVPVRLNFIDGTETENHLSLSVYPGADFLMDNYGTRYQQVENYYIMDVESNAQMLAGLREDVANEYLRERIIEGQRDEITKLLDQIRLTKHDHLAIPQEIIHSGGDGAIMLHVSTAPSIFKAKVYDEKRLRTTTGKQLETLIDRICHSPACRISKNNVSSAAYAAYMQEQLSPEENSQVKISRIWFEDVLELPPVNVFQVFNLIEGDEIHVVSSNGDFKPFVVHYAETFLLPAGIGKFEIKSKDGGQNGLLRVVANV